MLFFNESQETVLLENYAAPLQSTHFWNLDLSIEDFTLSEITMLEEIIAPSITLEINNFKFEIPSYWNILVADQETSELDVVDIGSLAGRDFNAVVFGHEMNRMEAVPVKAVDYSPNNAHTTITMNRKQMLCHPISPTRWVNISPSDSYNKYLKGKLMGDLYE